MLILSQLNSFNKISMNSIEIYFETHLNLIEYIKKKCTYTFTESKLYFKEAIQ